MALHSNLAVCFNENFYISVKILYFEFRSLLVEYLCFQGYALIPVVRLGLHFIVLPVPIYFSYY